MRIFGFAGWSGSGKTTLIEILIPLLIARVGSVSLIKHAHHGFEVDTPGKDSMRHRQAGCTEVLVSSARRWALMHELRGAPELGLTEALDRLSRCELVLVEGYKTHPMPKLEIWRPSVGKPLLHPNDPAILAVATDQPAALLDPRLPVFGLDQVDEIATFIVREAALRPRPIDARKASE
ncbi:MAG: molybdopterin-guanine dinucleotide biosynthesis protein B [Burkholderiales bacterium]|nr:molybdopterin-guanine dinucleotide biosynthesis protein B [Burkholderiales bacterium]